MTPHQTTARELITLPDYADEVVRGLISRQKTLPCKLFYDDLGSELFERITELPEYYPTRTELEILRESSGEIAEAAGAGLAIVELGAGTATKTGTLLRAFARRQMRVNYFPVDISPAALAAAQKRIVDECPPVSVHPVVADFSNGFNFMQNVSGRKLVLYLGSSIGNFDGQDGVALLRRVQRRLSPGDVLLLGTDMVKPVGILVPAYDDAQGVTAEFNKNILRRLNREFDGDFDLASFLHIAEWNPAKSRMEIYLESTRPQIALLRTLGVRLKLSAGERIHTENSYKYTVPMVERLLCASGFTLEKTWYDPRRWFGLHLARV